MSVGKKLRFEVFKRDKFTCQYCGAAAPDVVLHADHIEPKSKGGTDDILNLITACQGCNAGKSARRLNDDSVITKQKAQLDALQERREQLEMLMEWQRSLVDMDSQVVEELVAFWCDLAEWFGVSDHGKSVLRKLVKKFGTESVVTAMRIAAESYFQFDDTGVTEESSIHGFNKLGGICQVEKASVGNPYIKDIFYIRGILKKRLTYVDLRVAKDLIEAAFSWDATADELKDIAKTSRNWTKWRDNMVGLIIRQKELLGGADDGSQ